jgi:hypothetical protein
MNTLSSRISVVRMLLVAGVLSLATGCAGTALHNRADASQQLLVASAADGRGSASLARRDGSVGRVDRALMVDSTVTMPSTDGGNGTCGPRQEPSPLPIAGPTLPGR